MGHEPFSAAQHPGAAATTPHYRVELVAAAVVGASLLAAWLATG